MAPKLTFGVEFLTANAKQKLDSLNRSLDKTEKEAAEAKRSFKGLSAGVMAGAAAFTGAVYAAAKLHRALGDLAKMGDRVEDASRAFRTLGINIETLREATGREITDLELMEGTVNLLSRGLKLSQDQIVEYIRLMKVMSDATGESMDTLILRGARSKMMFDRLIGAAREFDTELSDTAGDAFARMETSATNLQNAFALFITDSESLKRIWDHIAGVMDRMTESLAIPTLARDRERLIGMLAYGGGIAPGALEGLRPETRARLEGVKATTAPGTEGRLAALRFELNRLREEATEAAAAIRAQADAAAAHGAAFRALQAKQVPAVAEGPLTGAERLGLYPKYGVKDPGRLLDELREREMERYQALLDKNESLKTAELDRLKAVEDVWHSAIDTLEGAIVQAALTGEFAFGRLADALLAMTATRAMERFGDWALGAILGGGGKDIAAKGKKLGLWEGQAGGVVPGPIGKPVPAIVHGGETITPPSKTGGMVVHLSVNFNVSAIDEASCAQFFDRNMAYVCKQVAKGVKESEGFKRSLS